MRPEILQDLDLFGWYKDGPAQVLGGVSSQ